MRVLLTGAAGGIGVATAAELRERGARVVGLDVARRRLSRITLPAS